MAALHSSLGRSGEVLWGPAVVTTAPTDKAFKTDGGGDCQKIGWRAAPDPRHRPPAPQARRRVCLGTLAVNGPARLRTAGATVEPNGRGTTWRRLPRSARGCARRGCAGA